MEGILRLPKKIQRDLILLVLGKIGALCVLYFLFFSPPHRPPIDILTHIAGSLAGR
ncbi:MAG TPA: hypothetical protein VH023_10450 [Rhodopila sp.]|jgi:hypothetical protein|nr:hypothetical protein [Rhodopila sp.]